MIYRIDRFVDVSCTKNHIKKFLSLSDLEHRLSLVTNDFTLAISGHVSQHNFWIDGQRFHYLTLSGTAQNHTMCRNFNFRYTQLTTWFSLNPDRYTFLYKMLFRSFRRPSKFLLLLNTFKPPLTFHSHSWTVFKTPILCICSIMLWDLHCPPWEHVALLHYKVQYGIKGESNFFMSVDHLTTLNPEREKGLETSQAVWSVCLQGF